MAKGEDDMNILTQNEKSIDVDLRLEIQNKSRRLLTKIGLPANLKGYEYINYSILLSIADRTYLHSIVKRLYTTIGQRYDVSASCVEHSIRHAISRIWNVNNYENLSEVLGYTYNCAGDRPTNAEFIALMTEIVKIELNLC